MGLSPYHVEDGIDNDVDGHGGWPPPVPHGPHALLVVGQEVVRQPPQSGPGGVLGREAPPAPGWEGEQFQADIKPEPQGLSPWFEAMKREVPSPVPPHKTSRCPTTEMSVVSADSSPDSKVHLLRATYTLLYGREGAGLEEKVT